MTKEHTVEDIQFLAQTLPLNVVTAIFVNRVLKSFTSWATPGSFRQGFCRYNMYFCIITTLFCLFVTYDNNPSASIHRYLLVLANVAGAFWTLKVIFCKRQGAWSLGGVKFLPEFMKTKSVGNWVRDLILWGMFIIFGSFVFIRMFALDHLAIMILYVEHAVVMVFVCCAANFMKDRVEGECSNGFGT